MTAATLEAPTKNGAHKHHSSHLDVVVNMLPIASIAPSPLNPRKLDGPDTELMAALKAEGQQETIKVRPSAGKGKAYEIVDGERRWRAMDANGESEIRCQVVEWDDERVLRWMLMEQAQKKPLTPLEEAAGFKALAETTNKKAADIALEIGKSEAFVYRRLALNGLCSAAKEALDDGSLKLGAAEWLAHLADHATQEKLLPRMLATDFTTGADARTAKGLVASEMMKLKAAPFDIGDAKLVEEAGACGACPKRSQAQGALFGECASDDDRCTDGACWTSKVKAHGARVLEQAKAKGQRVIEDTAGMWEPNGERLNWDAPWIDLSQSTYVNGAVTSWSKIVKDAGIEVVVAVDQKGHAHELADKKAAEKAADKLTPKKERASSGGASSSGSSTKASKVEGETEAEAEARAVTLALVQKAEKASPGVILRIAISEEIARGDCDTQGTCERRGLKPLKGSIAAALEAWAEKAHPTDLQGLYIELLASHDIDDARDTCIKALKVDITDVAREAKLAEKKRQEEAQKKAEAAINSPARAPKSASSKGAAKKSAPKKAKAKGGNKR